MGIYSRLVKCKDEWEEAKEICTNEYNNFSDKQKEAVAYAEQYEKTKVKENYVLYESFFGRGMTDNPYALFLELLNRKGYRHLQHFWVLDDFDDNAGMISKYKVYPNVHFIKIDTHEYVKALAECKYLINNSTFPFYFSKKKNQVYINTWHGTPLKHMGYERANGSLESDNTVRNFLCADYLLSANEILTRMYLEGYKMKGIYSGEIIEEGYPRNDLLVSTKREDIINTLQENGIEIDRNKKIILYAPTWRAGDNGKELINPDELLEVKKSLEENIDTDKYQILIKPHYMVYRYLQGIDEYKGLLVPSTIDTNEILSIVDVLISDYSSIFLDFLVLDRPVLFYVPDLQNYIDTRGLYIPVDELPGPVTDSLQILSDFIQDIDEIRKQYKDAYREMREAVCCHDDGQVSKKIIDIVFENKIENKNLIRTSSTKKKLLISPNRLLENGIVHSFLSLLEQIDYNEWDVTAFVSVDKHDGEMIKKLDQINPNVRVLVKCGRFVMTLNDEIRRYFCITKGLYQGIWDKLYPWKATAQEWNRNFGNAEFDYIVDFSGYSSVNTPMFLCGKAKKRSIWLHNDIKADMNRTVEGEKTMWRSLFFNISLYPKYDHLVSCSKTVMEVNRKNLSTPETYDKYTYASNTVNSKRILQGLNHEDIVNKDKEDYLIKTTISEEISSDEIEIVRLPNQNSLTFVTMGRMSTEKNQVALIKAFARFQEEYTSSQLYIIGDGPLRGKIEGTIRNLGVEKSVILTGNISNPFAIMKRCNCFILPSLHEGQPLVLIEARACGLPIILANFSTAKDSMYPDGQLLIENDEDSIYDGLCAFEKGLVPTMDFDVNQSNNKSYEEFLQAIS